MAALGVCCAGVVVLGGVWLVGRSSSASYIHTFPAPGYGCGDTGELPESGVRQDNWDNDDYAVITCHRDHVDIDSGSGRDPRGVHNPAANVFRAESNIDGLATSAIARRHDKGFLITVGAGVRNGGPDARAGITVQPYASNDVAITGVTYPVYYFNVDRSGRWHVAEHDIFGRYQKNLATGTTPPADDPVVDHILRVRFTVAANDLLFTVDDQIAYTVHASEFDAYRIGVGVACSYDPDNLETCMASFKDYRYELWR
jgi:hypothetical protein